MGYDNGRRRSRYYTKSLHRVVLLEFRMKFTSKDSLGRHLIRGQRSPREISISPTARGSLELDCE